MNEETESFLEVSFEDGKIAYNLNFENELRKLIRKLVSDEVGKIMIEKVNDVWDLECKGCGCEIEVMGDDEDPKSWCQ
jgi:hypothetical protein